MERLIIFDKDGTLIGVPSPAENRPANTPEEQILLPGVAEKIAAIKAAGAKIAIASNQGGVAWGFISYAQAEALLADCAAKIGADAWAFCPHDERAAGKPNARSEYAVPCACRKPKPGMIIRLAKRLRAPLSQVVFAGDRPEDEQAAQAAGVRFEWADEFFRR